MLKLLDKLLQDLLVKSGISLVANQISFEPPVPNWHTNLGGSNQIALNIYLVDLRENRKLRSNERIRTVTNGVVEEQPAPARLDCHYLISAWHPGQPSVEPTREEHHLLYNVAAALMKAGVLNPSQVYLSNPAGPNHWPQDFFNIDLPIGVVPVEGFPKLSEFWTSMGQGSRWRPVLYLIVTVPVELVREVAGPMVTTRITEYRQMDSTEPGEVWIQIGGTVRTAGPPVKIVVGSRAAKQSGTGTKVTVSGDAKPFRVGDTVTWKNNRRTITRIQNKDLTLSSPISGSASGNLRIANIRPDQATFRVADVTGLTAGGMALMRGQRAGGTGQPLEDRIEIQSLNATTRFVTLWPVPARSGTYNLAVSANPAPVLVPLVPVTGAWVRLETVAGEGLQILETNEIGRFTFSGLTSGQYQLHVRAPGFDVIQSIGVPSPGGSYDVLLS